jgi:hypothetical protein
VRGEFAALRKVARLASEVVRDAAGGSESPTTLEDLRAAIADLHERFPYSVAPLFDDDLVGQTVAGGGSYAGPSATAR